VGKTFKVGRKLGRRGKSWCEHSRRGVINLLFGKKRPPNPFPSCGKENLQLSLTFFWQGTGQLSPQAMLGGLQPIKRRHAVSHASNSAFVYFNFSSTCLRLMLPERYVVLDRAMSNCCRSREASRMHRRIGLRKHALRVSHRHADARVCQYFSCTTPTMAILTNMILWTVLDQAPLEGIVLIHTKDDIYEAIINPATFPAFQQVKNLPRHSYCPVLH
jgi:hypothetical protein